MKFWKRLLLTAVLLTAVSACTPSVSAPEGTAVTEQPTRPAPTPTMETAVPPDGTDNALINTEWTLESFGPAGAETPALDGSAVTLTFRPNGQAGGNGGCNTYGADYQVQGNTLVLGEVVSTLMACAEGEVTEQEQRYLEALRSAGTFEQIGDRLIIYYDDGQGALNFIESDAMPTPSTAPYPPAEGENSLVGTRWQLESFGPTAEEMPVIAGSPITLEFITAVEATGSGGCNSYGADYTVRGDTISFGQIISTEMACADQAGTGQEQRYFAALQTTESFVQTADRLTILYDNRQGVLNFVPASISSGGFPPEEPSRITFAPGETSAEISATISQRDTDYYVFRAFEDQELTAAITSPNDDVLLTIVGEDGMPIKRYQHGPPSWIGELPDTQDYYIYAVSVGPATSYTLYVQVDPL